MNCPICHDPGPAEWLRLSAEDAADYFCPRLRDPDRHRRLCDSIGALWKRDAASLMRCPACGFEFADPHVAGDGRFYSILHEQSGYPSDRWEYAEVARAFAATTVGPAAPVLDVGTGDGSFLRYLPAECERHATETSEVLRDALAAKRIDARADLDAFLPSMAGRFELVTLFQVIEHIADPREMLRTIARLMRPGGLFAVSTPNGDEQRLRFAATGYPDVPPNHVSVYGERSLSLVLNECGFDVVEVRREPPSRGRIRYALQLRTIQHARARPSSLAGLAQRVRSQGARRALTAASGLTLLPGLLRHASSAMLSCNFLTLARPRG